MSNTVKLGSGLARELSNVPAIGASTIDDIARRGNVSYSTARVHLARLVKLGLVRRSGVGAVAFFTKTDAGADATVEVKADPVQTPVLAGAAA